MSFKAPQDKMMKAPPSQKGFHFASDGLHEAMFIEAASIEEAETLYHKTKKLLGVGGTDETVPEQSTAPAAEAPQEKPL
ncbi:MAG TPA: hypothetical protein VHY35_06355 [Stellaceae bacterium]|jgi:hypothetical protein|nr:hypothetical protein [Stellaceae bacterium]